MIYTIDDLDDEAEERAENRRRGMHDRDLALSAASGAWWRSALGATEEECDSDELELSPDGSSVRRRFHDLPDNVPTFRPVPPRTWEWERKKPEE